MYVFFFCHSFLASAQNDRICKVLLKCQPKGHEGSFPKGLHAILPLASGFCFCFLKQKTFFVLRTKKASRYHLSTLNNKELLKAITGLPMPPTIFSSITPGRLHPFSQETFQPRVSSLDGKGGLLLPFKIFCYYFLGLIILFEFYFVKIAGNYYKNASRRLTATRPRAS